MRECGDQLPDTHDGNQGRGDLLSDSKGNIPSGFVMSSYDGGRSFSIGLRKGVGVGLSLYGGKDMANSTWSASVLRGFLGQRTNLRATNLRFYRGELQAGNIAKL